MHFLTLFCCLGIKPYGNSNFGQKPDSLKMGNCAVFRPLPMEQYIYRGYRGRGKQEIDRLAAR